MLNSLFVCMNALISVAMRVRDTIIKKHLNWTKLPLLCHNKYKENALKSCFNNIKVLSQDFFVKTSLNLSANSQRQ